MSFWLSQASPCMPSSGRPASGTGRRDHGQPLRDLVGHGRGHHDRHRQQIAPAPSQGELDQGFADRPGQQQAEGEMDQAVVVVALDAEGSLAASFRSAPAATPRRAPRRRCSERRARAGTGTRTASRPRAARSGAWRGRAQCDRQRCDHDCSAAQWSRFTGAGADQARTSRRRWRGRSGGAGRAIARQVPVIGPNSSVTRARTRAPIRRSVAEPTPVRHGHGRSRAG